MPSQDKLKPPFSSIMAEATRSFLRRLLGQTDQVKQPEATIPNVAQDDLSGMHDFSIDEYRPMKVVIIGAGFSGILAGIRFRQYMPNLEMTIYEKNAGVGGTWYSNRYPLVPYCSCSCIPSLREACLSAAD